MAKVKIVQICKSCKAQLIEVDQQVCHKCGYRQNVVSSGRFSVPDYVAYQKADIIKENEKVDISILEKEIIAFASKSQDEDRICALRDALMFTRVMVISECTVETIRTVTKLGKQIGVLAQAIESYAKAGGAINVSVPQTIDFDETEYGDASPNS